MSKIIKEPDFTQSIPRSTYPLTFTRRFTCNFGRLVPVLVQEYVPTDNFELFTEFILRTVPFIGQVFQHYRVSLDYFYVPNRLLWRNFPLFLSGGYNGSTEYSHPYFDLDLFLNPNNPNFYSRFQYLNSLLDYMDIAPYQPKIRLEGETTGFREVRKSLLPFAAYAKIIVDHYVNQFLDTAHVIQENIQRGFLLTADGMMNRDFIQLMNSLHLDESSSPDEVTNLTFAPVLRPYDYDYFTDQRTEQQHGPVMTIPLELVNVDRDGQSTFKMLQSAQTTGLRPVGLIHTAGSKNVNIGPMSNDQTSIINRVTVSADIFENVATIYDFREAARLVEFFESLGMSGWRPEDYALSQFNLKSDDNRLYQSKRLHHQTFDINVGEVFSNNASAIQSEGVQRDVPGVATSTAKGYGMTKKITCRGLKEYGYIVALASVYPDAAYSQGCPRMFDLLDRFDYVNPKFAYLGLQPTKNSELYHTGQVGDDAVFGYTRRYAEYTTNVDRVNSEFRDSYKYMTSSRLFNQRSGVEPSRPSLNEAFNKVQVNYNDLDRVFNVEFPLLEYGPLVFDMRHNISANRPFPWSGDPRL